MLNTIILMGRLTDTPELKSTPNGVQVTQFTLAVGRDYVGQNGERTTDFIDVVAWRKTAEYITKYFKKGQLMAVRGSLQTRTYVDKEGKNRKVFEVIADAAFFAESRQSGSGAAPSAPAPTHSADTAPAAFSAGDDSDFAVVESDEDLPF